MTPEELADRIAQFLPGYLSAAEYREVIRQFRDHENSPDYYWVETSRNNNEVLQGDGWSKLRIRDYADGELLSVLGIVLSNSCDIDQANTGVRTGKRVLVAPVLMLERYEGLLRRSYTRAQVDSAIGEIRRQRYSSIFYLPAHERIGKERIIMLDDIHSIPLDQFNEMRGELRFRLNNAGFYILLLKLSIHFTRMQENVARSNAVGS